MKTLLWAAMILVAASAIILVLVSSHQLRIFWNHARTDHAEDQITVDHFTYTDYVNHTKPATMGASDVYFGQFGGRQIRYRFILVSLPKECASERYILNSDQVLVPEGRIWIAGPVAFWWKPERIHALPFADPADKPHFDGGPSFNATFKSPTCGPIRVGF